MNKISTSLLPVLTGLLFMVGLGLANISLAARVENMYSAEVGVADTTEESREAGIKNALRKILVRVTGSRAAASRSELEGVLDRSAVFAQSYRYQRTTGGHLMAVTFDGQALQKEVERVGVPVWGAERPKVLVWLAIDYGGGNRSIVPADSDGPAARAIRSAATERGLPVSLPLMDGQDRERVSFADVWGGFTESVEAASARYAPDAILMGRARRLASGRLSVDWTLRFSGNRVADRGGLDDGIEFAADYFARQFAVGGDTGTKRIATLEVAEIRSFSSYARVLGHLEKLSIVEQVHLTAFTGDVAMFELALRGSSDQLRRALSLGNVLQERRSMTDSGVFDSGSELRYRPVP